MKLRHILFYSVFIPAVSLYAQQGHEKSVSYPDRLSKLFILSQSDSLLQLPAEYIVSGSETLVIDSATVVPPLGYYHMDYRTGTIVLHTSFKSFLKDSARHILQVSYRILPFNFRKEYFLHQIEIKHEPSGMQHSVLSSPAAWTDDMFGYGLQKSGSILRGFTVGNNRDLTINSGFRMQLAGKLSQDVDVVAALTDENSPLQPEGTTQTLREVDNVFIEVKNPTYGATLGDFSLDIGGGEGGEFGHITRKLLGAQGRAKFDHAGDADIGGAVEVTGATARGKFTTNQIQGTDGLQGPYRLTGRNGEQQLLVIAGSEHVYLDGNAMVRGETNDYTIDYADGEITFSSRHLITSVSRISVDFEYSDQQYTRNLISGLVTTEALGKRLHLNLSFIQEADDPGAPLNITLTDSMKAILSASGSDQYKASLAGASFAGLDTTNGYGLGQYKDTAIVGANGRTYVIYVYAPGDPHALFSVTFSHVGTMPADSAGYVRLSTGNYQFAGIGQGNYLPVQFLPLPQLHQVVDVNGTAALTNDFSVSGEYAASSLNVNRFSSANVTETGNALHFIARYNPQNITFGRKNYGELDINFSDRYVDKHFVSADRLNEVEFDRKWNILTSDSADEEIREFSLSYSPTKNYTGSFIYGTLERTGVEQSTRMQGNVAVRDSGLPSLDYQIENIKSSAVSSSEQSDWVRQNASTVYSVAGMLPGFEVASEQRTANGSRSDSLLDGSFQYLELSPKLSIPHIGRMSVSGEVQLRSEDSASAGTFNRAFTSLTQVYSWQLQEWHDLSSGLTLSLHETQFTDAYKNRGNLNDNILLVRSQSRYTPLQHALETDWYYEFSNQQTAKLERVFTQVPIGTGSYIYLGDLNKNGIADENEFEQTLYDGNYIATYVAGDHLYPVANLKASTRWRFTPSRVLVDPAAPWEKILQAISTETYLRVDEKSSDPDTKQIYFMNFSHFLNGQNTLAGSNQITQDLFLFEGKSDLSLRFRFSQQNGLNQYVSETERSYSAERSVRAQSQLIPEIGNQTDFISTVDRLVPSSASSNARDLLSNSIQTNFSYHPEHDIEVGMALAGTEITDRIYSRNWNANINSQEIRTIYSLPAVGQLRISFQRKEVVLMNVSTDSLNAYSFAFTQGNVVGKTFLLTMTFDYRVANNFQISFNYEGRKEGQHDIAHTVKAEARAFF